MENIINNIKFDSNGLVVAIAQDAYSNVVLMQAFMNREALEKTIRTGKAHYYSRSRQKLWLKGETSGHFQEVVSISADCDFDSVLLRVKQTGAACHTGNYSCYFNEVKEFENVANIDILQKNIEVIKDRKANPVEGSYTNYLLEKGKEKICKKIGEESSEVIIAAMKNDSDELMNECADLLYHMLVLLNAQNSEFNDVLKVLTKRYENERKRNYTLK